MSAAGHPEENRPRAAAALTDAEFVRLVGTADGDALAAAGLIARGLDAVEVPYQVSLAAIPDPPATDADCTVAVGHPTGDVVVDGDSLALEAAEVVAEFAPDSIDPELALAGAVCAGVEPSGRLLERADLDRRPGVAIPTDDPVEGLAGTTLLHASFSGDWRAVEGALDALDDPDDRTLASFAALSAIEDAPPRAAEAVERMLRPYVTDRFETLGGFADVLDALARTQPGTGVALALGREVETAAIDAWRAHGQRAHAALREADTGRYDGVYVVRTDDGSPGLLGTVARLGFAYRSPESIALAVTDGAAAAVGESAVEAPIRAAATGLGGRTTARDAHGTATFDGTIADFTAAFRGAL
ncbi:hypothetical protein [Natronomonas salsuginis]|uniref:Exonuclease RecJ n=1 Tax=Natronomonas salsuginis TaxID=2217661 RepID=A0A4U5JAT3_9EURY|nr:hypothetical protein [Natronomonas salsuginis]TKR26302.1 hypothetical protein DM868_07370 [Natronomonas salsuginis]